MSKKKKKAALYCRVGSGKQGGHMLKSQQNRLENYAKEAGLKIVSIISDMGTGLSMERPGWKAVLEAARQKQMQVLLVDSSDRISRNYQQLQNELWRLGELGVQIYSLKNDLFMCHISRLALKANGGTDIRKISMEELRTMKDSEGLVIQGCGCDLHEWISGINDILTEQGILRNGSLFQNVSLFEHDGKTNLLFHMDGVDLDMGKLAMWRLATYDQFGSTWLSDYLPNQLGVNMDEKPLQKEKPDCPLIGQDGNIYNLMGIASRTLKDNGLGEQATEMWDRVTSCGSYGEALCIIGEYVNITSAEDVQEQSSSFEMKQSY